MRQRTARHASRHAERRFASRDSHKCGCSIAAFGFGALTAGIGTYQAVHPDNNNPEKTSVEWATALAAAVAVAGWIGVTNTCEK